MKHTRLSAASIAGLLLPMVAALAQPAVVDQIESFGFHSRMSMGVGGFMTTTIYPVVLFKNGTALREVGALGFPDGLEAHRQRHPADWTRWRRQSDTLQIEIAHEWRRLHFQTTYPKLPDDFRLEGYFRMLTGAGTVAVGGAQSVAGWKDYRFFKDGRVYRGEGAASSGATSDGSVVTSAIAPVQRGQYRVEGLVLRMTFDDGSELTPILVTNPTDPKSAIWLDGTGYARRNPPR